MTNIEQKINRWSNDWGAKVLAFVLLALCFLALFYFVWATYWLDSKGAYSLSQNEFVKEGQRIVAEEDADRVFQLYTQGSLAECTDYFIGRNAEVCIIKAGGVIYGTSWVEYPTWEDASWVYDFYPWGSGTTDRIRVRVPMVPEYDDSYNVQFGHYDKAYQVRNLAPIFAWVFGLLYLVFQIFLVYSAGTRDEAGLLKDSPVAVIPLDIIVAFNILVAYWGIRGIMVVPDRIDAFRVSISIQAVVGLLLVLFTTLVLMEISVRLKKRNWYRNLVIVGFTKIILGWIRGFMVTLIEILKSLPDFGTAFVIAAVCSLVEFIGLMLVPDRFMVYWIVCKLLTTVFVVYVTFCWNRVKETIRKIANGDLKAKINTNGLPTGIKRVGDDINRMGDGLSAAVEERTRSEKLKTELITNVSHDIKTPVTSIVNYSDLMGVEISRAANGEEPHWDRLLEYTDVLHRQSGKLKKLVEDLVEASKATSGNLEINLVPCEIDVLVTQAISEYESRFERKGLEVVIKQPEDTLIVPADGKHLWRVIDNLLSNINKYAMENSRVYITVEDKSDTVDIVFKNMSKYALDASPEELKERFVRGDGSRNMEGHGLGLSIAQSLMELQGGQLEIITDGDLFKAAIRLKKYGEKEESHDK